jgi:hypothetical protein
MARAVSSLAGVPGVGEVLLSMVCSFVPGQIIDAVFDLDMIQIKHGRATFRR